MGPPDDTDLPAIRGYEISRRLGQGGMGIVYKALRLNDLRWVALKMIVSPRPDLKQRFGREVAAVARLKHPHIVELHDTGEHAGWPFFTMEYIDGGCLADHAGRYVGDARQAATLVLRLARAVHHAHEAGIVHRDLKPGNVLLTAAGEPKVADFGLAKCLDGSDSLTSTGAVLGTPAYMAPEVANGDIRGSGIGIDVYALGAIFYELLAGEPPFRGRSPLEVLDQIRSRPPRPPGEVCRGVPPALEALCLRCLEKSPAQRPASAQALADELEDALRRVFDPTTSAPRRPTPPTVAAEPALTEAHVARVSVSEPTPPPAAQQHPTIPGFEIISWERVDGLAGWYRARQTRVGRTVGLWVMNREHLTADAVERFRVEGAILSRLQHPNIVQLIDLGEQDGLLYRVEELLDSKSLEVRFHREAFDEAAFIALVATVARAVHHVHAAGVVHRNLKPGVVRFTAAGVVKLVDFGQAHAPAFGTDRIDQPGAIVGTPAFLSPEQARGDHAALGPATDVFGLGATLYAALTRRPPFGAAYPFAQLLHRIQNDPPIPPRQFNPAVSRRIEAICLKALEKEPSRRHATAEDLADDLDRAGRGGRVT